MWINTPRRPWEASGTSGMKVLVNGGLNLSELDGWWAEAYSPEVGWALGDGQEHFEPGWDAAETEQLYALLEQRGRAGVLRARRRRHPARLGGAHPRQPVPPHAALQQQPHAGRVPRAAVPAGGGQLPPPHRPTTCSWRASCGSGCDDLRRHWPASTGATSTSRPPADRHVFRVQVYLGEIAPGYGPRRAVRRAAAGRRRRARTPAARPAAERCCRRIPLRRHGAQRTGRPATTRPRVVPAHPEAMVPAEPRFISWYPA